MLDGWWRRLTRWRGGDAGPAAAVYLSTRSTAVAVGRADQGRYRLDLRVDPLPQLADAPGMLREQSRAVGLAETGCNLVLAPELYSVSLVERPPVPDAELAEAVRWRLQDAVDFPVDQAALDVFPLPESASRQREMVFVVALQRDSLKRLLDHVYSAGIQVDTVDVSELALRNVAHGLYPEPDSSVGLLRFTAASGVINITRGEELFLSRRVSGIPSEFSEAAWEEFNDRLLLQVQRSIDYYESAMSQPPCNALIVATTHGWQARVCEYLNEMLPVSVRPIETELPALFDVRLHNPEMQTLDWSAVTEGQRNAMAAALPALGGLVRAAGSGDGTVERAA